jgi:hypothetical protein
MRRLKPRYWTLRRGVVPGDDFFDDVVGANQHHAMLRYRAITFDVRHDICMVSIAVGRGLLTFALVRWALFVDWYHPSQEGAGPTWHIGRWVDAPYVRSIRPVQGSSRGSGHR